jgi:hypothetical protein
MFGWVGLVSGLTAGQPGVAGHVAVTFLDAITLLVLGWFIVRGVRLGRRPAGLLSVGVVGGLLASPHFYAQDLLLLVPVLWGMLADDRLPRKVPFLFAIGAWFIPYVHFAVLGATSLNLTTLYLLGLLLLLIFESEGWEIVRGRAPPKPRTEARSSV